LPYLGGALGGRVGVGDGHHIRAIAAAVPALDAGEGPAVLIAHTTKGRGVPFAEGDPAWHMGELDAAQRRIAVAALTATA
ncbi:hypothetical protein ACFWMG_45125, partial [Streptomyces sp. NPDC127074]